MRPQGQSPKPRRGEAVGQTGVAVVGVSEAAAAEAGKAVVVGLGAVGLAAVAHAVGQVVLPATEQVARELAQLPELAVGGALGRLELLRLDEEALLLEGALKLFALQRLARLAGLAAATVLVSGEGAGQRPRSGQRRRQPRAQRPQRPQRGRRRPK